MTVSFENGHKLIGLKQSRRAVKEGLVREAYVAEDVEERLARPFLEACVEASVPITKVPTMKELGQAAGIDIGAAVVVILKD